MVGQSGFQNGFEAELENKVDVILTAVRSPTMGYDTHAIQIDVHESKKEVVEIVEQLTSKRAETAEFNVATTQVSKGEDESESGKKQREAQS